MQLLDRYLIKQLIKNILRLLGGFIAFYLLVEFFERIDNFPDNSSLLALQYFLLEIPSMIEQLSPIIILLAGIFTIGLLNHNHELIALKAAGISFKRIIIPLISGTLIFIFFILLMGQWVLPATTAATNTIWHEKVKKGAPGGIWRKGRIFYRGKEGFYSFTPLDSASGSYSSFTYAELKNYTLSRLEVSEKAEWKDDRWILFNGHTQLRSSDGNFQHERFAEKVLSLPESPQDLFVPDYRMEEQSYTDLYSTAVEKSGFYGQKARNKLHAKLSFVLLGLPLLLICIPILLFIIQRWDKDLVLAIPISCLLAFLVWTGWGALQSLTHAHYLDPLTASWGIHILLSSIGLFLIRQQDK